MKVAIDLNVVLDVVQRREPHYAASAAVLSRVAAGTIVGFLPAHALPTLYYIVARFAGPKRAGELTDWLLRDFQIAEAGKSEFLRARALPMADFEDAVVAACSARARCEFICTRNLSDYEGSPVPALTPEEFMAREAETGD